PDELPEDPAAAPPSVFVMCERLVALETLRRYEEAGATVVNGVGGIRNTYRDLTIQRFEKDGVPFPRSVLVESAAPLEGEGFALANGSPCWLKRGDVHATEADDVVFVKDARAAKEALGTFSRRGIARAVLQEHVPGDLIKFYGVGTGAEGEEPPWFVWFYHRGQELAGHRFDEGELSGAARRAAASLSLVVFGGDAIATPSGRIVVIDLNAWPSFALYRPIASERIAAHLAVRFTSNVGASR
ncbi:MAG TPA: hypothetical protein VGR00_00375, partial [Thermoanaerobaculia bacterium]|nr:hypothetical protein [Thermoanaerobaculia bacterium]